MFIIYQVKATTLREKQWEIEKGKSGNFCNGILYFISNEKFTLADAYVSDCLRACQEFL